MFVSVMASLKMTYTRGMAWATADFMKRTDRNGKNKKSTVLHSFFLTHTWERKGLLAKLSLFLLF